jgi:hypothetical protein
VRAIGFGAGLPTAVRYVEFARRISPREQEERSPDRHRDIGHREIRVLEVMCIGTVVVVKSRWDLDHPFVWTRGRNQVPSGEARHEGFIG